MKKLSEQINNILLKFETFVLAIITISLVICVFLDTICRYFFFISLPWVGELTRYLFIWMTYIGSAYAVYYGQHTEIDVLQQIINKYGNKNKGKYTFYLKIASIVSTLIFQIIFGKLFFDYMMTVFSTPQSSPTMHIPMWIVYLPVFIGILLAAIHCICMLFDEFDDFKKVKHITNLSD